jgi:hypothetical protein
MPFEDGGDLHHREDRTSFSARRFVISMIAFSFGEQSRVSREKIDTVGRQTISAPGRPRRAGAGAAALRRLEARADHGHSRSEPEDEQLA